MKEYLKKNGIRIGIIVAAVALIIGLGSAARNGKISLGQNAFGIFKAPVQKAMSSTVNWFKTIYGYLFDYDSLLADNESLRTQLAEAQQAARRHQRQRGKRASARGAEPAREAHRL